jgi:hypothetical protein
MTEQLRGWQDPNSNYKQGAASVDHNRRRIADIARLLARANPQPSSAP